MASVINSARKSTASVFDLVGAAVATTNSLIDTATKSVDMLDAKAQLMHTRVVTHARAQMHTVQEEEIMKAADLHTDFLEDIQKKNYKDADRQQLFEATLKSLKESMAAT